MFNSRHFNESEVHVVNAATMYSQVSVSIGPTAVERVFTFTEFAVAVAVDDFCIYRNFKDVGK